MRIAHFSDTHVLNLEGVGPRRFLNKRWTGAINLALNRAKHYRVEVFEELLAAVAELKPDHTVCTGDLVNLALEPEFVAVRAMLRQVFAPEELTLVPGNHDYYVKEAIAAGLFERSFGEYLPSAGGSTYPVSRRVPGATIVGLSSAIPTPVFMATGHIGAEQLGAMRRALEAAPEGDFRMLLLHHPLLPDPGRRMERLRRLQDASELMDALRACPAPPQLVVHGHNHAFRRQHIPGTEIPIVQVASGSRFGHDQHAEFNVYVVEDGELVGVERHIHQVETGRFLRCDEEAKALVQKAS